MLLALLVCLVVGTQLHIVNGKPIVDNADDFFHFRTRPDILAPRWNITIIHPDLISPGYIFAGLYQHISSVNRGSPWIGPHIYDQQGELIWSGAPLLDHYRVNDFRVQRYRGQDVLTAIYFHDNAGVILDSNYRIIREIVHTDDHTQLNMHEFSLFDDGARAVFATRYWPMEVSREISAEVGFEGKCRIKGNGFRLLDLTTEPVRVLLDWNATDAGRISLNESMVFTDTVDNLCGYAGDDKGQTWDPHHINSIELLPDKDFLVSARYTNTIYKISHIDGSVVWRLGGERNDFTFPDRSTQFYFQHHARFVSENATHLIISLFDNETWDSDSGSDVHDQLPTSRGIVLALDLMNKTVVLVNEFRHPLDAYTISRGSTQIMPNGNVFMGWADHWLNSEHDADGTLLGFSQIRPDIGTYRTQKADWIGRPSEPPSVYSAAFVSGSNISTKAFVSWNGDTETQRWNVYAVDSDGRNAQLIAGSARRGFETEIELAGFHPYVVAEARDSGGNALARSRLVRTVPPAGRLKSAAVLETSSSLPVVHHPMLAFLGGVVFALFVLVVVTFWRSLRDEDWTPWRSSKLQYGPVADGEEIDVERSEHGFVNGEPLQFNLKVEDFG